MMGALLDLGRCWTSVVCGGDGDDSDDDDDDDDGEDSDEKRFFVIATTSMICFRLLLGCALCGLSRDGGLTTPCAHVPRRTPRRGMWFCASF